MFSVRKITATFLVFLMVALSAVANGDEAILIQGGKSRLAIVVEDCVNPVLNLAGEELASHLKERTGAEARVYTAYDELPKDAYPLYLGRSERTRKLGLDDERLAYDGYFIKVTREYAVIAGRDNPQTGEPYYGHTFMYGRKEPVFNMFGERGTLNGVYKTLEEYAGVRHYMPGELGTVIPKSPDFKLPLQERYIGPAFRGRNFTGVWFQEGSLDFLYWHHRICAGGERNPVNHSYNRMGRYKQEHPEYFALIDGKRDFDNLSTANHYGNLCMTNTEGIKAFANIARAFFDQNPNYNIFPIVPQDGLFKVCECQNCQKLVSPHLGVNGRFSNIVFHHAIEVAKEVKKTHPDKFIGALAYAGYRIAPEMEIPDNMYVVICYRRQDLLKPAKKKEIEDTFKAYQAKKAKILVWTYALYNHIPPMRGIPVLYSKVLQENIRFNLAHGVIGEKSEATYRSGGGDQLVKKHDLAMPASTHLNDYIRCQLLWNPKQDVVALLDEYYRLFYGPAQQEMRQFWETAEALFAARGEATMYSKEDLQKLEHFLEQASSKAAPETVYGKRVRLLQQEIKPFFETLYLLRSGTKSAAVPIVEKDIPMEYDADGIWKYARNYVFTAKDGKSIDKHISTNLKMLGNKQGIALYLEAKEPNLDMMVQLATKRDEPRAWKDDCYEIFLVSKDRSVNLQYIITAAGNINDGRREVDVNVCDWDWTSSLKLKQSRGKQVWNTSIFIPWSDLGLSLNDMRPLLLEIFRRQTGGDKENGAYQVLFPTAGFHNYSPEYFGELHLIPSVNQVKNPSFEVLSADGRPLNWGKGGKVLKNADGARSAIYLSNAESALYNIASDAFPVKEGTEYMLHYRHKGTDAYSYAVFFDARGKNVPQPDVKFFYSSRSEDWKAWHFQGKVPSGTVTCKVFLRCFDKTPDKGALITDVEFFSGNLIK